MGGAWEVALEPATSPARPHRPPPTPTLPFPFPVPVGSVRFCVSRRESMTGGDHYCRLSGARLFATCPSCMARIQMNAHGREDYKRARPLTGSSLATHTPPPRLYTRYTALPPPHTHATHTTHRMPATTQHTRPRHHAPAPSSGMAGTGRKGDAVRATVSATPSRVM